MFKYLAYFDTSEESIVYFACWMSIHAHFKVWIRFAYFAYLGIFVCIIIHNLYRIPQYK